MINKRQKKELPVITLSSAAVSAAFDVTAYKHILLSVGSDTAANLTFKVRGAAERQQTIAVSIDTAQGLDNRWDYIQVKDREDDAGINGDTGIALSGKDARLFEVNTNSLDYIAIDVTAYTAGTGKVVVSGYSNA